MSFTNNISELDHPPAGAYELVHCVLYGHSQTAGILTGSLELRLETQKGNNFIVCHIHSDTNTETTIPPDTNIDTEDLLGLVNKEIVFT